MIKNSWIVTLLLPLLLTGCEKVIELDYKSNSSRLVIEGNVTNEAGPYWVRVSRSVELTASGAYPTIDDAVVTISDDAGNSETLLSQGEGLYSTATLAGVEGRKYTLDVQVGDQHYTAESTMPHRVPFDSIRVNQQTFGGVKRYDLIPVYKDPIELGNIYRFVVAINRRLLNQHLILDDELTNGQVNAFSLSIHDIDSELQAGDPVEIMMQCIDARVSLYYSTLSQMAGFGPGGGITPNNPPSNLSNGALGLFSAHTVERQSTVIPE